MEVLSPAVVAHCTANKFESFFYLLAVGTRGGILLAWDATVVSLSNPHYTNNTLTALVKPVEGREWWITGVYGPQSDQDKIDFLQEMVEIRDLHAGPWVVVGDFNLLVNPEDKSNAMINRRMMARFRAKLNSLELKEIYLNGRRYTWSNERVEATLEKIDHMFSTSCWEEMFPTCQLTALGSSISDHCPLFLDLNVDLVMGQRFRFEAFWPKMESFFETVEQVWGSVPSCGNPFVVLDLKLRATAKKLKQWSDRRIGNVKLQIGIAMEVIARLDKAMDVRQLSVQEIALRRTLKKKLLGLCSLERTIARQCSRILYLREGDANTGFFHQHARHRQRRNMITTLRSGDSIFTGHEEIANEVDNYYSRVFGEAPERPHSIDLSRLQLPCRNLSHLEEGFTEEEVEKVVKGMPLDKAPGPDGFTGRFYASCWHIIKADFMRVFDSFYRGDMHGFSAINKAVVSLLPKIEGAMDIKDFRPVSLVHGAVKIFDKVLATKAGHRAPNAGRSTPERIRQGAIHP